MKIYHFDGRRSVWGGECGRYELARYKGEKKENFFELRQKIWQTSMQEVYEEVQDSALLEVDGRPTVGMQRALYGANTAVLWAHFFDRLGFRLVLTPLTNQHISKVGIEAMQAETCFPVKVSHGHVKELIGKTRYLFLPSLIDMPTQNRSEMGYYCPMVQSNSYMVRAALRIDRSSIVSPTIHLKHDPDTLCQEISEQIKTKLGVTKAEVRSALSFALEKNDQFAKDLHQKGQEILENHTENEPIIVVTGRPYNLYDERLNLRLGQNLSKIGLTSLPMDFIDVSSVELSDFPNMYWGFGTQILKTAKFTKKIPHYFGLHLTNFGCGADSFIEHFYKFIMGAKAYLILELDEHSAVAGVMTRLEAFKNVIENAIQKLDSSPKRSLSMAR